MPSPFPARTTRRGFLASCAGLGLVGGAASTRPAVGSESAEGGRFILDATTVSERRARSAGLEVVYDLERIDRLVVAGAESAVARLTDAYVPDERVRRRPESGPAPEERPTRRFEQGPPTGADRVPRANDGTSRSAHQQAERQEQPDAPYYPAQWDKQVQEIGAVHEVTRGEGTRVAIVDSGVQADHPDLRHAVNLSLSRSFANDGFGVGRALGGAVPDHGTACAGVVAANGTLLLGSAPAAEIVDCRVFEAAAGGQPVGTFQADYLAALVHAAEVGCDVANLSLGPGVASPIQWSLYERLSSSPIVEYANEQGMVVVVSAGNDAIDLRRFPQRSFAPQPGLLVVSATGPLGFGWPTEDRDGDGSVDVPSELEEPIDLQAPYHEPALYTNYGAGIVGVSAPGGNLDSVAPYRSPPGWHLDMLPLDAVEVSYDPQTGYAFEPGVTWSVGTSYAAPQVAAAAALVRSVRPSAGPDAVQEILERTAADVGRTTPDPFHGAGFLNPNAAVRDE